MAEEKITVQDIGLHGFSTKDHDEIKKIINTLGVLTNEYKDMEDANDVEGLERIKREFVGWLQYFTPLYAKVKKYKDGNHQYLGEHRKRLKSLTLQRLLDEGTKTTAADKLVYGSEYYTQRLSLIESFGGFFEFTENSYKMYLETLKAIQQSISVAKDEKSYTRATG